MLTFGIVAEGSEDSDVKIISELVKKILNNNPSFILRPGRSKHNVIEKFSGWLEDFRYRNVDKALIIIDEDMSCRKNLIGKLYKKIRDRKYRFPVKFHIIRREIETWLLADEKALSKILGTNISRVNETLEEIQDPKTKLKIILSKAQKNYTGETLRKIAEATDIESISSKCPGFRRFQRIILDC
jgi:hypothetical protein